MNIDNILLNMYFWLQETGQIPAGTIHMNAQKLKLMEEEIRAVALLIVSFAAADLVGGEERVEHEYVVGRCRWTLDIKGTGSGHMSSLECRVGSFQAFWFGSTTGKPGNLPRVDGENWRDELWTEVWESLTGLVAAVGEHLPAAGAKLAALKSFWEDRLKA